jgi:methionyl-tRNA synthetase
MTAGTDFEQMYEVLSSAFDSISRVARGLCPKCGAERTNDDCANCGHHSIYVEPFWPDAASTGSVSG